MTVQSVIENIDATDPTAKFYGQKPWFIKKLPSRIEILEAENFDLLCRVGRGGSKPWFVKTLPRQLEVTWGDNLEAKCLVADAGESIVVEAKEEIVQELERMKVEEESLLKKFVKREERTPLPPAGLRLCQVTSTSAGIEWDRPLDDGGARIIHYILEKRESGSATWETLTTLPPVVTECDLDNMTPGREYFVRLRVENSIGISEPVELQQPIKVKGSYKDVPSKPGRPLIQEVGEDYIELTWESPASDGGCPVTHYVLERRETRGPQWVRVQKTAVQAPPYTLQNVIEGAEYEFRVCAKNVMGFSELSELSKSVITRETDIEPPSFTVEMRDVSVEEGEKAWFDCNIKGMPDPEVRWFKNFREVFDGYKHKIMRGGDKCTFIVSNVGPEDCGEVECRAYNKAGTATNRAKLSLQIPAKLKISPLLLESMNFHRGEKIRIRVPVVGQPFPKVTWVKDGEVMEECPRYEITENEGLATLVVHDAEKSDSGKYEIIADNPLATDSAVFTVFVQDRPDPPQGKPQVTEVAKETCKLDWQVPSHDGGAVIISYTIEKSEQPSSKWEKVGSTHLTNMQIHRLKDTTQYKFRVLAENVHGFSDPSEESDSVFTQEAKLDIDYDRLVIQDNVYSRVNPEKLSKDLHGRYIICEELGRGTYGVVHRAIERATGKCWAAKFMKCSAVEKPMLKHEMEIMNELHHPKLLKLREVFDVPGENVMMLEMLSGCDLLEKLTDPGYKLTEESCIDFVRQICQGVAHVHKSNMVHLDIKPENVIFTTKKSKNLKLIDFGLTQYVDPDRSSRVLFGSYEFCAPELLAYKPVSFSTDMWSLGVLAYLLLSGINPFHGDHKEESLARILEAKYDFSDPVWLQISDEAKQWITSLLQRDKKKRMTIGEALAHPWLNGETEGILEGFAYLPTDKHSEIKAAQEWRKTFNDVVSIGRLAHMSPIYRRMKAKKSGFERDLVMELPDAAPQVVMELSNNDAYEGTVARFKCKFQGKPEPTIKWYHEGELLMGGTAKYELWFKRGLAMLNIENVDPDDAGQYTCVATNMCGSCTTIGELNVQEMMWRRRQSLDLGRRRRRSMSYDHDSVVSMPRACSVDRINLLSSSLSTLPDSNIPPQFTLPLLDHNVPEGQKMMLNVHVTCKPEPELAWFHNQQRILSCEWCTVEQSQGVSTLTVHKVGACDAGVWRVLAINAYGQAMTVCKVGVIENVPANFIAPRIIGELNKSVVFEGNATKFDCHVTGFPEPDIIWLKNRRPLPEDFRYEMFMDENARHCLVIHEVYQEDGAHYTCMAINQAGSAYSEAELVVECLDNDSIYEIARSTRSCSSIVSDLESVYSMSTTASGSRRKSSRLDMAPQFTARLRPKRGLEGSSVRYNCSVSAFPMPEVVWMKGSKRVNEGGRFHISHSYGLLSLEISNLKPDDSGVYTVKITNLEGEAVCSATLEVQDKKVRRSEDRDDDSRKPWFILEPQNSWAEVGQRAVFEAQSTGRPTPDFKWQRDSVTMEESENVKLFSDEQGNCKLVINSVEHSDTGMYFCTAENKAGKVKTTATLRVVDKGQMYRSRRGSLPMSYDSTPRSSRSRTRSMSIDTTASQHTLTFGSRESTPTGMREKPTAGVAPWFLQTISSAVNIHQGDPLSLQCVVDGDPKPKVIWMKDPYKELSHSKRHAVAVAGDTHQMDVKVALKQDSGRYIVVAENSVGRIQASCWVNVLPPREYGSDGVEIQTSFVELPEYEYDIDLEKEHGKMAPKFTKRLPKEIQEHVGQTLKVECRVSEAEVHEVVTDVKVTKKVIKEGGIKTVKVDKSGEVTVTRNLGMTMVSKTIKPGDEDSSVIEASK